MDMNGQRVLVTGGTSGVGRALAEVLVGRGAKVVVCGRSAVESARAVRADLGVPGEAARTVAAAVERLGGLDVVVANAGVQYRTPLTLGPVAETLALAREEIEVNLASVVELAAAAWPHLAATGRAASFVAVTSGLGYAPKQSAPVYCATKAAVHVMVESLRHQSRTVAPQVGVQEVVLPLVDTAMTAGREGPARKIAPERAALAIVRGVERGRDTVPVGASRMLLALLRVAPPVAKRILRDG
ncbi:SDR family oxidoreductase [Kitasatospora paracochleata]